MIKTTLCILTLALLANSRSAAQDFNHVDLRLNDQGDDFTSLNHSPICIDPTDFVDRTTNSSVVRNDGNSAMIAGSQSGSITPVALLGAAGITWMMMRYDQRTYQSMYSWEQRHSFAKKLSPNISMLGDGKFSLALFSGFLGYSMWNDDNRTLEVARIGFESFLVTGVTVQLLKHTFSRERPSDATVDGGKFHRPFSYFSKGNQHSSLASFDAFPSGHTATAFAAATTIADFYPDKKWVQFTSYSLATLVGVSRITERTHWLSDCFAGGVIGYCAAKLTEHVNYGATGIDISPYVNPQERGILLSYRMP